jgi:prepilin-type processing-associated H-X9-DG protein
MSRRVVAVIFVLLLVLVAIGFIITYLQKARMNAYLATSRDNLRQLSLYAAHYVNPDPKLDPTKMPKEIPAGTVVLPNVPPEDRLSWFVSVLPSLDQRRQDVAGLLARIDNTKPWSAERNQQAARTRLVVALSPLNTPQVSPDQPAVACYAGIAGVGTDAATLALPPLPGRAPARAGAFRYDAATPFDRIGDGLGQTLLLGETSNDPGPWLRGGPSTVRGLDDGNGAKTLIGAGGQFGGYFPSGANFAMCDGSVRMITPRVANDVLLRLATIDEGADATVPGE